MANDLLRALIGAAMNGGNVEGILRDAAAAGDEKAAEALSMVQGRNGQQVAQLAGKMCGHRGMTFEEAKRKLIMQVLGL